MQPSSDEIHPPFGEEIAIDEDSVSIVVHHVVAQHSRALVRRGQIRGPGGFQKCTVVKTISPSYLADPSVRRAVVGVVSQAAQLTHPSIAQIYDATFDDNETEFNIVSECVDGYTVATLIERAVSRGIPLPGNVVVWIMNSIVDALAYAKESAVDELMPSQLAHGHLHPNNILIRADGQVKITDFGLATALGAGAFVPSENEFTGTFSYMAPEQIGLWHIDERTDVFALGLLLYMLTLGDHPFRGQTDVKVCQAIRRGLPQLPSVLFPDFPRPLEAVIERALAVNPELRFQTIDEFRAAAIAAFEGSASAATRAGMEGVLSILFPEQSQTHSGKWQRPAGLAAAGPQADQPESAAETPSSERQNLHWAIALVVVTSALFWLLIYPML